MSQPWLLKTSIQTRCAPNSPQPKQTYVRGFLKISLKMKRIISEIIQTATKRLRFDLRHHLPQHLPNIVPARSDVCEQVHKPTD